MSNNVIEKTAHFKVYEHSPGTIYKVVDLDRGGRIGVWFTNDDAAKFNKLLDAPMTLPETMDRRLRKIVKLARRNIDSGLPKL